MTKTGRDRARRRWRLPVLVVLLIGAGLIAALPWILGWPIVQRRLAAAANAIMAPGSVEFSAIRLSWFQPTQIADFVLRDAQGDPVLAAPKAVFQWNLGQILLAQPSGATLTFQQGDLDIERFADGKVDLLETLKPVIVEHPRKRLVIRIVNGRLRFRDPAFPEPVVAHHADVTIDLSMDSQPITWAIQLARDKEAGGPGRLEIAGNYSRAEIDPSGRNDLTLSLKGTRWPWTLANSVIESRGDFSGSLDAQRRSGRLLLTGDATVTDLVAIGDLLASDTIHLDTTRARWKVAGGDGGWTIDQLELTSPLGSLEGQGTIPSTPEQGAWFQGAVDLAVLSRQLPGTLRLRDDLRVERGSARLRAELHSGTKGLEEDWNVTGKVSDLVALQGKKRLTLPEPATLTAKLHRDGPAATLERLELRTPFLTATGHGDLDGGVALAATLDLAAFRERFRDWIDLGPIVFSGEGKLDARYRRHGQGFQAQASGTFRRLRIDGLSILEQIRRDELTFDGEVNGKAAPSGWPLDWTDASLRARSDPDLVQLQVRHDATGNLAMSGRGQAQFHRSGRPERVEGELKAMWDRRTWTAEPIALALVRRAEGGARPGHDQAIHWAGRGRYDPRIDELVVESTAGRPRAPTERDSWLSGNQRVRINGLKSLGATQIEVAANVDLASIGGFLSPNTKEWNGQLDTLVRARPDGDLWNLGVRLELHDPARTAGPGSRAALGGNVVLGLKANYAPRSDRLELTELGLRAPYLKVDGAGVVRDLTTRADVDLAGSLNPDWKAIGTVLAQKVEPNARIAGRPSAWRIAGPISDLAAIDQLGSFQGELGVQIDELDVFGMRLGEVPVVARAEAGRLRIDPIEGTLNGGALYLEPEFVRDQSGSTWLRLGPSSKLSGAIINDEVSHRVLSFAAPVLDGATRVQGRVSVELAEAVFPILAVPDAEALIKGDVLFDNVRFMPGHLADQLLSVFQKERKPLVVIRDPISVRITGRKVYQKGLVIPVANLASIGLDGSVDFDKNLDLVARFSLNPPGSDVPILTPILQTARFEVPIRGTLTNPKIDGEAMKERWKGIGTDLLQGSMEAGLSGLQRLLQGIPGQPFGGRSAPGRPGALPPPPRVVTPDQPKPGAAEERQRLRDQRREQRLQKKAARRLEQSSPPRLD
ncbi:MAG: hypothetical protein ACHRXM_03135 [Isosphaerales bacterium]